MNSSSSTKPNKREASDGANDGGQRAECKRQKKVHVDIPKHHNPSDPAHFDHFLFHLLSYRAQKQSFVVTKQDNDESSVKLLQFTQFLKQEYRDSLLGTSQLSPQQFAVLESLHVPLTTRGDDHWNRFYCLLEQYKGDHGHVIVPRHCPVPGLGDWVAEQRRQRKLLQQGNSKSRMTPERLDRLEALGFVWEVRQRAEWDDRFKELESYKKEFGNCKVPQQYRANRGLGKWVAKQREQHKLLQRGEHSFLNDYRIEKLESVGFTWIVRSSCGDDMDAYLRDTTASIESAESSLASSQHGDESGKSAAVHAHKNAQPLR